MLWEHEDGNDSGGSGMRTTTTRRRMTMITNKDGEIVEGTPSFLDNNDNDDDTNKEEGSAVASQSVSAVGNAAALPSLTYASRTIRLGQGKGGNSAPQRQ